MNLIDQGDDFESIREVIHANENFRNKEDLLEGFAKEKSSDNKDIFNQWIKYVQEARKKEIQDILADKNLNPRKTGKFIPFKSNY